MNTLRGHAGLPYKKVVYRIAVGTFFFLYGATFASWAARIPTVQGLLDLNEAELGSILFLLPLGSLAVLPLMGTLINRYGSKKVLFWVSLAYALVLYLLSACSTVFQLSLTLFFFGFTGNALNIAVNTQALQLETRVYGRSLMSSFHALWSAGAMTGALLTGWMIRQGYTMETQYMTIVLIMILLYTVMYFFLAEGEKSTAGSGKLRWPTKLLWLLGAICFCCAVCEGAMADWSALYYKQVMKEATSVSTTGYTAFALMMAIGRLAGDRLVDRFGAKTVLLADAILLSSGFIIGVGILHPLAVIAGFGIIGLGVSTIIPIVYTISGKNPDTPPSVSLATVSSIGFSGFLMGPPLIGYMAHAFGLRMALGLLVIMGLIIFGLSRKLR